jgi:hypothetical protein
MSQAPQTPQYWRDNADRDYKFAGDLIRARAAETSDASGHAVSALLACVNAQQQRPIIKGDTVPLRNEGVRIISWLHAALVGDKTFTKAPSADRQAHVFMTAVGLYDVFLDSGVARTLYCHPVFALACYSIAFKTEENHAMISHKQLLESLGAYCAKWKRPWSSSPFPSGIVTEAEIIVLDVVEWRIPMYGTLVQIDNILEVGGGAGGKSALLNNAYEIANDIQLDLKMLGAAEYSPFYSACSCVKQACDELKIPTQSIFGDVCLPDLPPSVQEAREQKSRDCG